MFKNIFLLAFFAVAGVTADAAAQTPDAGGAAAAAAGAAGVTTRFQASSAKRVTLS